MPSFFSTLTFSPQVNSFEQLCINFCNEKLQFHFNEHIFRMEQELYASEGINIPGTAFVDNQPTLDLLEAKVTGIFSMTDEEINVPRGSDEGLLQKVLAKHADGKHPNLIRPKARDCKDFLKNFGVLHYAGPVYYNVTNFLEKNKDQLHADIIGVLQASQSPLITKFFPEDDTPAPTHARSRGSVKPTQTSSSSKKTLGFQFKTQLNELIATLNSTFPHFVRCMKSNDLKAGNVFTSSRMQDQLRYAGLVEVCRIRKLGYPVRRPFLEFYKRYRCIELSALDLDSLLSVLVKRGVLKSGEWAKGHTRVFMRSPQSAELELAREASLVNIAILFQKNARRMVAAKKYKYYKKIINDIHLAIGKREEQELKSVIDLSFELPWNGAHLKVVQNAKLLLVRVQEEKRVIQLLEHAISIKDINALKSALAVHTQMSPPFETPLAQKAKELLVRLEEELILKTELTKAISARERSKLVELLAKADRLQSDCNEVHQARALVARLDKEAELLVKLKDAMNRESLDDLNALFSEFKSFGMETLYPKELAAAHEVKTVLIQREAAREEERRRREAEEERQRKALEAIEAKRNAQIAQSKAALQAAIAAKDVEKLNRALQDAIQSNVQVPEVEEARGVLISLKKVAEMRSQLQAALDVLKVKSETGIQELDLLPLQHAIDSSEQVRKFTTFTLRF